MKINEAHIAQFFQKTEQESAFGSPVKAVERLAELLPSGKILDLGAGDGRHALYLAKKGFDVTAVDISPSGIEKLKRLAMSQGLSVQTEVADASTYKIHEAYEAIVVVLLFQFLDENASIRLMNEIKAHTKPGGVNVIHVFTKTGDRADLDREEDPTAFYPNDGWLQEFYADWEIIEHDSSEAPLMKSHPDGTPMKSIIERIVARKSR